MCLNLIVWCILMVGEGSRWDGSKVVDLYSMTSRPSFLHSDNWVHPSSMRSDEAEVVQQ